MRLTPVTKNPSDRRTRTAGSTLPNGADRGSESGGESPLLEGGIDPVFVTAVKPCYRDRPTDSAGTSRGFSAEREVESALRRDPGSHRCYRRTHGPSEPRYREAGRARGPEGSRLGGAGPSPPGASGPRPPCRKRRKSRTAFTAQQLRELEQRFRRQRYLSPVDRDALAARLALSAAQVITWFQNRRAKLKRDLEELRADVASLQALPPAALQQLAGLPEPPPGAPGTGTGTTEPAELSEEEIDVAD
ncbi:transcription factor LBX2 [Parus major]|uniref:transcription factor LBX2 n=1 Tax=Parus major TaxID=9157 RepID=UPI0007714F34|nr:transcription factor LBX2 [Parus major]